MIYIRGCRVKSSVGANGSYLGVLGFSRDAFMYAENSSSASCFPFEMGSLQMDEARSVFE